jgi:hypothetical protein
MRRTAARAIRLRRTTSGRAWISRWSRTPSRSPNGQTLVHQRLGRYAEILTTSAEGPHGPIHFLTARRAGVRWLAVDKAQVWSSRLPPLPLRPDRLFGEVGSSGAAGAYSSLRGNGMEHQQKQVGTRPNRRLINRVLAWWFGGGLIVLPLIGGQSRAQPGCRGEGKSCEGNQQCCAGLACRATGPGSTRRCARPQATTTPTATNTPVPPTNTPTP